MKPIARRANIFSENLPNEVVLYNKQNQQVHCLNKSAAIVWENADGTRSIDDLALLVERELNIAAGRDLVLVALDQLAKADLLERKTVVAPEEVSSRRAVAKKLAMAGMSAAMLPVIASMTAPSASAATTTPNLTQVKTEASDTYALISPYINNNSDTQNQKNAVTAYSNGYHLYAGQTNPTQAELTAAQTDYDQAYADLGKTPPF